MYVWRVATLSIWRNASSKCEERISRRPHTYLCNVELFRLGMQRGVEFLSRVKFTPKRQNLEFEMPGHGFLHLKFAPVNETLKQFGAY